jgi:hypothetical protein
LVNTHHTNKYTPQAWVPPSSLPMRTCAWWECVYAYAYVTIMSTWWECIYAYAHAIIMCAWWGGIYAYVIIMCAWWECVYAYAYAIIINPT